MAKLPVLPYNNTDILYLDYEGATGQHTFRVRFSAGAGASAVASKYNVFAPLLAAMLTNDAVVTGGRYQAAGTLFSTPFPSAQVQGAQGAPPAPSQFPRFISLVGRSVGGRRVRYTVFNTFTSPDDDYRLQADVPGSIKNLRDALNSSAEGVVAVDNTGVVLKTYANTGFNSYYQRKRRAVA